MSDDGNDWTTEDTLAWFNAQIENLSGIAGYDVNPDECEFKYKVGDRIQFTLFAMTTETWETANGLKKF